jgi:hypothetical protein
MRAKCLSNLIFVCLLPYKTDRPAGGFSAIVGRSVLLSAGAIDGESRKPAPGSSRVLSIQLRRSAIPGNIAGAL